MVLEDCYELFLHAAYQLNYCLPCLHCCYKIDSAPTPSTSKYSVIHQDNPRSQGKSRKHCRKQSHPIPMHREDPQPSSQGRTAELQNARPAPGRGSSSSAAREGTQHQSNLSSPQSQQAGQGDPGKPLNTLSPHGRGVPVTPTIVSAVTPSTVPRTRVLPRTNPSRWASGQMMPIPIPTARSSLLSPRVPQPSVPTLIQTPRLLQGAIQLLTGPCHPLQALAQPSTTSSADSGFRTMRIGIETEFYLTARDRANSRETLDQFIKTLTTNHNRVVVGRPQMQRSIRTLEYDGTYEKWGFVRENSITSDTTRCTLLRTRLVSLA
jgi:hypothetical protein